ncbi:hypothetical protein EK21DRAFT_109239 [Setomelanomma holmii]|uniref:Uncharacterized protein n=1 Tax=Setomelanomma holmii TaxID=210430 RepID=A0A9P4HFI2_9PLEO|nr:hypothetical protein EK21DRAFT_109239 [Setomelanomma holmii]
MDSALRAACSSPADPDRLSFLDLSAEIRNIVYGLVYEHSNPLIVTRTKRSDEPVTLARRLCDENRETPMIRRRSDVKLAPNHLKQAETSHPVLPNNTVQVYQTGLSLFCTCYQSHREAASVFYANNTFLIIKKRIQWAASHGDRCECASYVLVEWLKRISTYTSLVKNMHLDLDSMCPLDCGELDKSFRRGSNAKSGDVDFTKFLTTFWSNNLQENCSVVCVKQPFNQNSDVFREPSQITKLVQSICEDSSGFKAYSLTLGRIIIKMNGSEGSVAYLTTNKHIIEPCLYVNSVMDDGYEPKYTHSPKYACEETARTFSLDGDGQIHFQADEAAAHLLNLPESLRRKVWNIVLSDAEGHPRIPLDTATDLRTTMAAFSSLRAHFGGTSKLERLIDSSIGYKPEYQTRNWRWGTDMSIGFLLEINIVAPAKLEDVRIAIMPLILATSLTWNDHQVTIRVTTPERMSAEDSSTLGSLRRRVLTALGAYSKKQSSQNSDSMCPELWVNGRGTVKEINRRDNVSGPSDPEALQLMNSHDARGSAAASSGTDP